MALHRRDRERRERVAHDRLRVEAHHVADGARGDVATGRERPPEIAVRHDSHEPAVAVDDRVARVGAHPAGAERVRRARDHPGAARPRRLDDRVCTIERIMTAENPEWRQQCLPGRETIHRLPQGDR